MPKKSPQYTIGIDIGGTKMRAILFDGKNIIAEDTLGTPQDSLKHFIIMINALIEPLLEKAKNKVTGIGLGVPGLIDLETRRVIRFPNIPILNGMFLEKELEEKLNLPFIVDNDASCFLRAEMKIGAGKKYKNAYGITIGTGIGGAWWIDNKIYQGAFGGANEPGQMITNFDHPLNLEEAYQKLNQGNATELAEKAYRGDTLSQKAYEEIGKYLGIAIANISNLIDPEIFILGGGVANSSDLFFSETKKQMNEYIMSTVSRKKVKIVKSKLGKDAGAIGAALLVDKK